MQSGTRDFQIKRLARRGIPYIVGMIGIGIGRTETRMLNQGDRVAQCRKVARTCCPVPLSGVTGASCHSVAKGPRAYRVQAAIRRLPTGNPSDIFQKRVDATRFLHFRGRGPEKGAA